MKRLIWLTLVVVTVLALLVIAPSLINQKGYVLIQAGTHVIETNLVSLGIIAVLAGVALVILKWAVKRLVRLLTGSRHWLGRRKTKKQQQLFEQGMQALMLNQPENAVSKLQDTVGTEFGGMNYLSLGLANIRLGQFESAETFLKLAQEYPETSEAALVLSAEAKMDQGQPAQAITLLQPSMEANKPSPILIKTFAKALAEDGQWTTLERSLGRWKKPLGEDYSRWAGKIAQGKLSEVASRHGANQLKQTWADMPRKQRNDDAYIFAYVEQLLAQGMHSDAQAFLLDSQKKGPNPLLLPLFKRLELADPSPSFKRIEQWIKADSDNEKLYSTLGHLAYHCADPVLAQKALSKAITLKPSQEDMLLLAQISEDNNDANQALSLYKQSADYV